MIHRRHWHDLPEESPAQDAELKAVSSERLELLSRKHGGGAFTSEDQARLDSLSGRLRQLAPRVTERDLASLQELERELTEREQPLQAIRRKHGLLPRV